MFSNAFCIVVVKTPDSVIKGKLSTTNSQRNKASENTEKKGINCGNHDFLLFPQCFLLYQRDKFSIKEATFNLTSSNAFKNVIVW